MKTLVQLLGAAIYDTPHGLRVDEERVPRDDGIASIVRAIQEWLGQEELAIQLGSSGFEVANMLQVEAAERGHQ